MADNVAITAGSGTTIKTDQLADTTHVQYVKLMDGTADGTGAIPGDATNGLDVDVTRLPSLPAGSNAIGSVTANIGTTNGLTLDATLTGGTQRSKITDGTNNAAVKAASTAAVATDPALVVAISPNNTVILGTGSNAIGSITNTSFAATQATASSLNAQIVGNVASLATDSGNPVKIGGVARTANPTAATDGQRIDLMVDKIGRIITTPGQIRTLTANATATISTTTETTVLAAGGAGVFHDLVTMTITNTSATAVRVDIRSATAGTVIMSIYCPATSNQTIPFSTPLAQATANGNWTAQLSAAVTDIRVFMCANKNI